jgi:hypothetical protein
VLDIPLCVGDSVLCWTFRFVAQISGYFLFSFPPTKISTIDIIMVHRYAATSFDQLLRGHRQAV